ncbi:hypothetical protein MSAN_00213700 [Mycena sanguinolenta]|uniref:Uncharacterized protein n=1 Tax=Mycena sanguinolenta TaxID=230812 RepID=A0A8H6ZLX5_9AGAR|nr:hypothetical protein MSAN_00213700 [Mycena sanguinolenta]
MRTRVGGAEGRALGVRAASVSANVHPEAGGIGSTPAAHGIEHLEREGTANERRSLSNRPLAWVPRGRVHAARAREHNARGVRFATLDPPPRAPGAARSHGARGRSGDRACGRAGADAVHADWARECGGVDMVGDAGNWHFHNMAHMMAVQYGRLDVQKEVDGPKVMQAVRELVERRLRK